MISRRRFLSGSAALLGALALPRALRAAPPTGMRFVFVFAQGGWDPTFVFAPMYGSPNVDSDPSGTTATVGGISFVDSALRPDVRLFFERWHSRTLVLNGMQVRSLAHEICTELVLTAGSSGVSPDWATTLAAADATARALPHLVLSGPTFAGDLSAWMCRTGEAGQLEGLLSGEILSSSDQGVRMAPLQAERILDDYMLRRAAARADHARPGDDARLAQAFELAQQRANLLKSAQYDTDFSPGQTVASMAVAAVDALASDLARCVTLGHPNSWDTHQNINTQSGLFEDLFSGLLGLMDRLAHTPDSTGAPLLESTLVVVLSEMGRTPQLNGSDGKDHWPFTSAMLVGPGITGSRVVGAYDDSLNGKGVDPATAEVDEGAPLLSVEHLGATLLTLGGVDPELWIRGGVPLVGALT